MDAMSVKAKFFITLVIVVGWLNLASNLVLLQTDDPVGFLVYIAIALLTSGLKLRLPGITGTISVCFLFILIGIVSLNLAQVLLAGCLSVLVQYFWHSKKRLRLIEVLFNIASASIGITVSYDIFHSVWLRGIGLELPIMLAILACTYFVSTTVLVAGVIALTEKKSILRVWHSSYLWVLPYYMLGSATAGLFQIAKAYVGWQSATLVIPAAYLVYRSYRLHLGQLEDAKKHAEEMAALHLRTIESLALAIEAKDHTTHNHLQRVQVYAVEIGKVLNLTEIELQAVRAASLLHDIGKIAIPEHILCKPGKLTPEEFEQIKVHPVVGAEILERAQFPYPVVPIVRSHHEKWDGSGYPDGLKEHEIPLGARILSVVDCLDALASDRQYRRALPLDEAMEMVVQQSGKAFDPQVVEVLQTRVVELERLATSSKMKMLTLSTDVKIERGAAPDAGFEQGNSLQTTETAGAPAHASVCDLVQGLATVAGLATPKELLSIVACRVQTLVPCDCMIFYARDASILSPEYVSGGDAERLSPLSLAVGKGLSGWVAANRKPILNGNPSVDYASLAARRNREGLRSALAIPLEHEQNVLGVLTLFRVHADAFSSEDLRALWPVNGALGRLLATFARQRQQTRCTAIPIAS
jgi:putative nucleotidyltransferase with HDIG domain